MTNTIVIKSLAELYIYRNWQVTSNIYLGIQKKKKNHQNNLEQQQKAGKFTLLISNLL